MAEKTARHTYEYIDIHSHLNFPEFDEDREAVVSELMALNIATFTVGVDLKTSQEAVKLAGKYENLYATIGLHPADNTSEVFDEKEYGKLLESGDMGGRKIVAVGECGLDYACLRKPARLPDDPESEKKRQKELFEKQIAFAVSHDKPLMIHCRDAYPDALDILRSKKKEYGEKLRGNFHFFTSPIEIAKQCLAIDFTVSFTGPITFAKEYAEIVEYVPLDKMMAETDSPFAAPKSHRGKRNSPLYIQEIVAKIAEIKKLELETVKKQLVRNVERMFW